MIEFNNTYSRLPERFFQRLSPSVFKEPRLMMFNHRLADDIAIECGNLSITELAEIFSGKKILPTSEPLALAYAGHQFGHFVPQLGDGRAMLLGELLNINNQRFDIQLKGSGSTSFSRRGDGFSALGPVIREYIISEAMSRFGISTTRSLAIVTTGDFVKREKILPGGVLARVASSHIRIGTFEYFAARRDHDAIKLLADYTIERHFPEISLGVQKYERFFDIVLQKQAKLVADWMGVGFIHGVMNTDNMLVCGETIDYGPCAFMDEFKFDKTFSSIDVNKRYCFGNQPLVAQWNLRVLGYALSSLLEREYVEEKINNFPKIFYEYWMQKMASKLGLNFGGYQEENDLHLIKEYLEILEKYEADFTLSFYFLAQTLLYNEPFLKSSFSRVDVEEVGVSGDTELFSYQSKFYDLFSQAPEIKNWHFLWKERLSRSKQTALSVAASMLKVNPVFIPRNHLIEEVINRAVDDGDSSGLNEMLSILSNPFSLNSESLEKNLKYMSPPKFEERVVKTFCGT